MPNQDTHADVVLKVSTGNQDTHADVVLKVSTGLLNDLDDGAIARLIGPDATAAARYALWRKTHPPIMGAEEPDPDPTPDPDPDPTPDPDPDPDPDQDETSTRLGRLEAENQRLKREAAGREKQRREAEREAKKAEDQRKAQQGEWQKLAEERATAIEDLQRQIADRDRREAERDQRSRVETAAERLNFRRPKRAFALLVDELGPDQAADTLADEQLTEAALKRLARSEPELVDQQRRSGAPVNGRSGSGGSTPEQGLNSTIAALLGGGR